MKVLFTLILLTLSALTSLACEVCEKRQPSLTKGITHGEGPQNNLDWYIVVSMCVITLLTLFYFIKYLIKPELKHQYPIKYKILHHENESR
ncbi:MAG: hypothetical protein EP332_12860 [Bacteroidetes bacterium]|nr:MAG: hypothetical protein EP332_12860 [Bacteroidota bacterium]